MTERGDFRMTPEEIATVKHYEKDPLGLVDPYAFFEQQEGGILGLIAYKHYETFWVGEIGRFLQNIPGPNVLVLGCGTGEDGDFFQKNGFQYFGIDLSDMLLGYAVSKNPEALFSKMNIRHLGFRDNSFDGVWAFDSVNHIPKNRMRGFLDGVRRVMKPDAAFYIKLLPGDSEGYEEDAGFVSRWHSEDFDRVLKEAHFNIQDFQRHEEAGLTYIVKPIR